MSAKIRVLLGFCLVSCIIGTHASVPIHFPGGDTAGSSSGDQNLGTAFQTEANALLNINDFAAFFHMPLPKTDPFQANASISTRLGIPSVAFDGPPPVQELPQAVCTPELTSVPLDLPVGPGLTFFPTCVRVERCGGCCFLSHHSCQPTAVDTIIVKAVKVQEEVSASRRRRVRDAEPNYIAVEVERHLECGCNCKLQPTDCNPAIHSYNSHYCECSCKNKNEETACLSSPDHFWNSSSCECLCRATLTCSSGTVFDHSTCRCVHSSLNFDNYADYFG